METKTSIVLDKALKIPGWMTDAELEWLGEQATTHNLIVEIGAFLGRSTRALADNTPGKVITIDDFFGPRKEGDTRPDGQPFTDEDRRRIFIEFSAYTDDLMHSRKLKVFKTAYDNIDHIPQIADLIPDMVFIDGDHSYEAVKRDITFWKERLVRGGLLCGHDWDYGPVSQAVRELVSTTIYTGPGTRIWYTIN